MVVAGGVADVFTNSWRGGVAVAMADNGTFLESPLAPLAKAASKSRLAIISVCLFATKMFPVRIYYGVCVSSKHSITVFTDPWFLEGGGVEENGGSVYGDVPLRGDAVLVDDQLFV